MSFQEKKSHLTDKYNQIMSSKLSISNKCNLPLPNSKAKVLNEKIRLLTSILSNNSPEAGRLPNPVLIHQADIYQLGKGPLSHFNQEFKKLCKTYNILTPDQINSRAKSCTKSMEPLFSLNPGSILISHEKTNWRNRSLIAIHDFEIPALGINNLNWWNSPELAPLSSDLFPTSEFASLLPCRSLRSLAVQLWAVSSVGFDLGLLERVICHNGIKKFPFCLIHSEDQTQFYSRVKSIFSFGLSNDFNILKRYTTLKCELPGLILSQPDDSHKKIIYINSPTHLSKTDHWAAVSNICICCGADYENEISKFTPELLCINGHLIPLNDSNLGSHEKVQQNESLEALFFTLQHFCQMSLINYFLGNISVYFLNEYLSVIAKLCRLPCLSHLAFEFRVRTHGYDPVSWSLRCGSYIAHPPSLFFEFIRPTQRLLFTQNNSLFETDFCKVCKLRRNKFDNLEMHWSTFTQKMKLDPVYKSIFLPCLPDPVFSVQHFPPPDSIGKVLQSLRRTTSQKFLKCEKACCHPNLFKTAREPISKKNLELHKYCLGLLDMHQYSAFKEVPKFHNTM